MYKIVGKIDLTRKDLALSAISMNSALADKEFFFSLHVPTKSDSHVTCTFHLH